MSHLPGGAAPRTLTHTSGQARVEALATRGFMRSSDLGEDAQRAREFSVGERERADDGDHAREFSRPLISQFDTTPVVMPVIAPRETVDADGKPTLGSQDLDDYAELVVSVVARPIDAWAVTATLESQGLRDTDAEERWGIPDLFTFGELVYERILTMTIPAREIPAIERESRRVGRVIRYMLEGSLFAMPMLGQIVCLFATRYSLWASLDFTEAQATLVGLGTLSSFAVSGAQVMTIGRQGTVYQGMKAYGMLRRAVVDLAAVGMVIATAVLVVAAAIELAIPFVSARLFLLTAAYYAALCMLWITLAALYMLRMHAWNVIVTVVGALAVAALVRLAGVGVHLAQLTVIAGCAAVAGWLAWQRMTRLVPRQDKRYAKSTLPRADVVVGIVFPFALYGLCYFALLFTDRVMAWTAPGRALPQPIWFFTAYELGLDWALASLLIPMSFLEYAIRELGRRVTGEQVCFPLTRIGEHKRRVQRFARRCVAGLAGLSAASVVVTFIAVRALRAFDDVQEISDFFADPITEYVYWPAAIGYQFLTFGLLAALVSFMWARPLIVVRNMGYAVLVAVLVGFVASRLLAPHQAVLGFVGGTFAFAAAMLHRGWKIFEHVDFYYYSAF